MLAALLALMLLFCCGAYAQGAVSAYEAAISMAEMIPEMQDVREMPLEGGAQNRTVWTDARINGRCELAVYESEAEADRAALAAGTRYTSVRTVDCCLLSIDSDLAVEHIDEYEQVLAEMLGVETDAEAPDYILNVNTKKFHYPHCSSVEDMKESNKQAFSGDREEVIAQGYKACKRCNP